MKDLSLFCTLAVGDWRCSGGTSLAECHPIGTEVNREETSNLLG